MLQHGTIPKGMDVLMFKARKRLDCKIGHIRQVLCDMSIRKQWESILYDLTSFDTAPDMNF